MKKILILLLLGAGIAAPAFGQTGSLTITGVLSGLSEQIQPVYLSVDNTMARLGAHADTLNITLPVSDFPVLVSIATISEEGRIQHLRRLWADTSHFTLSGSLKDAQNIAGVPAEVYQSIQDTLDATHSDAERVEVSLQHAHTIPGIFQLDYLRYDIEPETLKTALEAIPDTLETYYYASTLRHFVDGRLAGMPEPGSLAPDFELWDADSNVYQLSDHFEKPVLLAFMSTGCSYSIESLPEIRDSAAEAESLQVISVWSDRTEDVWMKGAEKRADSAGWLNLWDPFTRVTLRFWADGTPAFILIAPGGEIQDFWYGYQTGEIREKIERFLK